MITSFEIENYRSFQSLKLEGLKRVNLIGGKNNVGKTSLLEALILYLTKGNDEWVAYLFGNRGEMEPQRPVSRETVTSLFYKFNDSQDILITDNGNKQDAKTLIARLNKYQNNIFFYQKTLENPTETQVSTFDSNAINRWVVHPQEGNLAFVPSKANEDNLIKTQWSKILLTEKEDIVVEGLRVIDPKIIKVGYADFFRKVMVRLDDVKEPRSLNTMGDGINRVFAILLSLVNSENGTLLIDEFENGLHYSIQEKLWEIIFKLAKQLNVQVFATTHSSDAIRTFAEVSNKEEYKEEGLMFRLSNKNGHIKPVYYNTKELMIAVEQDIETR